MADEDDAPEGAGEGEVALAEQQAEKPDDQQQEAPELTEVEKMAAEMRWVPKDQWAGNPADWKPAADFLRDTITVNSSLKKSVKAMERQLENIGRTSAAMTERAVMAERERLEALYDEAFDRGDKDATKKIEKAIGQLDAQPVAPAGPSPEVQDWIEKQSSWFGKDQEATAYATMRCQHYADQGLSHARQLKALEKDMRELFPDVLPASTPPPTPAKPQAAVGAPERTARTAPRQQGYATLPPEARKAADAWVAANGDLGAWATKDAWAENYYASQEAKNG